MSQTENFVEVSQAQGARFFSSNDGNGPVFMLNLLKFRDIADYEHAPELTPDTPISGKEAYAIYMAEIEPLLNATGGEVILSGNAREYLIGPEHEGWDFVMLVKQASKQDFLAFASDPNAQRITQHRTAAALDSRLLPVHSDA